MPRGGAATQGTHLTHLWKPGKSTCLRATKDGNIEVEPQCRGQQTLLSASGQQWLNPVPTGSQGKEELEAAVGGSLTRSGTHPDHQSPPGPFWLVLLQAGRAGSKAGV